MSHDDWTVERRVDVNLQAGHWIAGRFHDYVHRCPGSGCAVAAWLVRKDERIVYESLAIEAGRRERAAS